LEAGIDRLDASLTRVERAMRRLMIVLTVWGVVSTGFTIYLGLQVWREHGL
jgi:hypothetical protein